MMEGKEEEWEKKIDIIKRKKGRIEKMEVRNNKRMRGIERKIEKRDEIRIERRKFEKLSLKKDKKMNED